MVVKSGLSVGVLSAELGVSAATLRKWEARYGFPVPMRSVGGARIYDAETVAQLRLARIRLAAGERPGEVLCDSSLAPCIAHPDTAVNTALDQVLTWLRQGQPALCEAWLAGELARLGAAAFADDLLGPLLVAVGQGWSEDRVRVLEEHGLSALVLKVLAAMPLPPAPVGVLPAGQTVPTVLLTTLAGEQHSLGLAMVKAVLKSHGARPVNLGASLPLEEVVAAAQCFRADIVALSLSPALSPRLALQSLSSLRLQLPATVSLWLGGGGVAALARIPPGIRVFTSCRAIEAALQQHAACAPSADTTSPLPEPGNLPSGVAMAPQHP